MSTESQRDAASEQLHHGMQWHRAGEFARARDHYRQATRLDAANVSAWLRCAEVEQALGNFADAERDYARALALAPNDLLALIGMGDLLRRLRRHTDSARYLEQALSLAPESADALGHLALLRIEQAQYAQARELAASACDRAPENARWWNAAGIAARRSLDADAAVVALRRACQLAPNNAASWFELALALERTGDPSAREAITNARRLAPHWERLRWIEQLILPAIAGDEREASAAVSSFDAGLTQIERELRLDTPQEASSALDAVLGVVTFQLHYLHGDHTALQLRFGALVERIVARAAPGLCTPVDWLPLAHGGRIRIGFVSPHLHVHSVARFFASWIVDLDRARFETRVWHCGSVSDEWTTELAAASAHFEHASSSLGERIRAAQLDVLILLDIGLDPRMQVLAAMRLAPRQYTTFGHPVTSGQSTLDGFLSAELLEGEGSERQYSEPLVRLPGLGIRMRRRGLPGDAAWLRDLAGDRPVLLCLQNLIKLQPAFDTVLARCVRETGAMLVFFELSAGQTRQYCRRLQGAFATAGVDFAAHVRVVQALAYADFLAGIAAATLVLDSPGFSGGATSLDAITVGTPIVTFAGSSARARQTSAMLKLTGAPELIAHDADDYVRMVVELCADDARRADLRQRLRTNSDTLYEDREGVRGLERFLVEAVSLPAVGSRGTS
ncbi:MAG TPA: tetratricopeptide repeat protein [Rhodanobacteraceae bacterium]|nr:tetratricopeptide repeat protein [Rhodanobacteraceae bacterium]